jgi:hypothetical protein
MSESATMTHFEFWGVVDNQIPASSETVLLKAEGNKEITFSFTKCQGIIARLTNTFGGSFPLIVTQSAGVLEFDFAEIDVGISLYSLLNNNLLSWVLEADIGGEWQVIHSVSSLSEERRVFKPKVTAKSRRFRLVSEEPFHGKADFFGLISNLAEGFLPQRPAAVIHYFMNPMNGLFASGLHHTLERSEAECRIDLCDKLVTLSKVALRLRRRSRCVIQASDDNWIFDVIYSSESVNESAIVDVKSRFSYRFFRISEASVEQVEFFGEVSNYVAAAPVVPYEISVGVPLEVEVNRRWNGIFLALRNFAFSISDFVETEPRAAIDS